MAGWYPWEDCPSLKRGEEEWMGWGKGRLWGGTGRTGERGNRDGTGKINNKKKKIRVVIHPSSGNSYVRQFMLPTSSSVFLHRVENLSSQFLWMP